MILEAPNLTFQKQIHIKVVELFMMVKLLKY